MPIKVLWVEEEPQSLRYEMKLAEQQGWEITAVATASEALELMNDAAFDLVVVDLILPADSFQLQRGLVDPEVGMQLITSIRDPGRKGCTLPDVPLLVITAVVSPRQKAQVVEKLTSDRYYLTKPLQNEVYREVLIELTQAWDPSKHSPL